MRYYLNNGRFFFIFLVMLRFFNGLLMKEKIILFWGCIFFRWKFGFVVVIDLCILYYFKWLLKLDRCNDCIGIEGIGKIIYLKKGVW